MTPQLFQYRSGLPSAVDEVFAWHERPGALERLTPPWEKVSVVQRSGTIRDGDRVTLTMEIGPVPITWVAEHRDYQPGRQFRDVQNRGPFAHWEHLHRFEPAADDRTIAEDRIEYVLPAGKWGQRFGAGLIDRKLRRAFRYRHDTLAADLAAHAPFRDLPRHTVALSGSSGLIGSALAAYLNSGGHHVKRLVRGTSEEPDAIRWNPATGESDWTGIDAVVHLAGESVAARWTPAKKARIRDSRVIATGRLARSLARAARPPGVLVCASAIGFYGNRGDEELDEDSSAGTGFLAEVAQEWERAAQPAVEAGIRVVHVRFGVVLSPRGGALGQIVTPFSLAMGGPISSGRQYWSWISIDDAIGAIEHCLMTPSLAGPVNLVAPRPVTNREFTATLARVLHRPALIPVPARAIRLALGEMADEMLLASARVLPRRLERSGYPFRHPDLETALRHLLGRHE